MLCSSHPILFFFLLLVLILLSRTELKKDHKHWSVGGCLGGWPSHPACMFTRPCMHTCSSMAVVSPVAGICIHPFFLSFFLFFLSFSFLSFPFVPFVFLLFPIVRGPWGPRAHLRARPRTPRPPRCPPTLTPRAALMAAACPAARRCVRPTTDARAATAAVWPQGGRLVGGGRCAGGGCAPPGRVHATRACTGRVLCRLQMHCS